MIKEITVIRKQRENKENGAKFYTYSAVKADTTLIDCRFVKEIKDSVPDMDKFIMVVDTDNMNTDKRRLYPVLWVKKVEEFKEIERNSNKELEEMF